MRPILRRPFGVNLRAARGGMKEGGPRGHLLWLGPCTLGVRGEGRPLRSLGAGHVCEQRTQDEGPSHLGLLEPQILGHLNVWSHLCSQLVSGFCEVFLKVSPENWEGTRSFEHVSN